MCTHCVYKKTDNIYIKYIYIYILNGAYLWAVTKINMFHFFLPFLNSNKLKKSSKGNVQRKYQIWKLYVWGS